MSKSDPDEDLVTPEAEPHARPSSPGVARFRLLTIEDALETQHTNQVVLFAITAALGFALLLLLRRVEALESPVG